MDCQNHLGEPVESLSSFCGLAQFKRFHAALCSNADIQAEIGHFSGETDDDSKRVVWTTDSSCMFVAMLLNKVGSPHYRSIGKLRRLGRILHAVSVWQNHAICSRVEP